MWGRTRGVPAVAQLIEGCKEVKLPEPPVESGRLELFDEVSIGVLVETHHCSHEVAGRAGARKPGGDPATRSNRPIADFWYTRDGK